MEEKTAMLRRFLTLGTIVICLIAPFVLSACGATGGSPASAGSPSASHYQAHLDQLNGSGVSGTVNLELSGTVLTVTLDVRGLEPSQRHYQHIHGAPNTHASCPTTADENADGILTLDQASPHIGPVAFDVQPYPITDTQGQVQWSRTYQLAADELQMITPLTARVFIFHGMTYRGAYDRILPIACGPIRAD
jgi:hypothetical protein